MREMERPRDFRTANVAAHRAMIVVSVAGVVVAYHKHGREVGARMRPHRARVAYAKCSCICMLCACTCHV